MKIGIIGGTGFYEIEGKEIEVETNYGNIIVFHFVKHDRDIFFIPRHGKKHIPAHMVNYHANIEAMKRIGIDVIFAISTVGSMKKEIKPSSLFIPSDFIDFTKRKTTFFDEEAIHIDMSEPFCPVARKILLNKAKIYGKAYEGIYAATEGPRLETKAEINMLRNFAHVVGMTLVPEVILAREAGICYSSLCIVSNYAAGLQKFSIEEIKKINEEMKPIVFKIIEECIKDVSEKRECKCRYAPHEGKI